MTLRKLLLLSFLSILVACGSNKNEPRNGASGSGGSAGGKAGSGGGSAGATAGSGGAGMGGGGAGMGALPDFDAGSDPNRNMVDTNQLCERLSTIQCAGEEHCCANPGRTRAQCEDAMKTGCLSQLHLDEIAAKPNTGFDKARAETAFTAFEHMASLCDPSIAKWGITVDGLRGILQGTLDATESCMPSVTNLMNPVIVGAALASCKNLETTACLPTMFSWTCAPVHGEGGACFTDANCSTGLYCDNPNSNQFNSPCRARKADGAACVNANECDSLRCKNKVCATAGVDAAYCLQ